MDILESLTITDGALAMDGGSVFLDAVDNLGHRRCILLGWSISAQRTGQTSLRIDDRQLAKCSPEEEAWVRLVASAVIAPRSDAHPGSEKISSKRLVLANDVQKVLEAGEQSPLAGLTAIRDSLIEKIRSPIHAHQA